MVADLAPVLASARAVVEDLRLQIPESVYQPSAPCADGTSKKGGKKAKGGLAGKLQDKVSALRAARRADDPKVAEKLRRRKGARDARKAEEKEGRKRQAEVRKAAKGDGAAKRAREEAGDAGGDEERPRKKGKAKGDAVEEDDTPRKGKRSKGGDVVSEEVVERPAKKGKKGKKGKGGAEGEWGEAPEAREPVERKSGADAGEDAGKGKGAKGKKKTAAAEDGGEDTGAVSAAPAIEVGEMAGFYEDRTSSKQQRRTKHRTKLSELERELDSVSRAAERLDVAKEAGDDEAVRDAEMSKALMKAQGVKVKDQTGKLRKTIRKEKRRKEKSREEWDKRKSAVEAEKAGRQQGREEKLKERREGKGEKGKGGKGGKGGGKSGKAAAGGAKPGRK